MNINNVKLSLNELMRIVSRAEQSGKIQEAVSIIENNLGHLEGAEKATAESVSSYLKKKLPQTAQEVSARVQVEMSSQLNKIKTLFSRISDKTILNYSSAKPVNRENFSMLRENLETNTANFFALHGRDFWLNAFRTGVVDGLTGKAADSRFMTSAQRLVDLGVIDSSTLVIAHTDHNIPIAKQLMNNSEKLGKVNGVIDISPECFPKLSEQTENIIRLIAEGKGSQTGLSSKEIEILEEKIQPFEQVILFGDEHKQKQLEGYKREIFENAGRIKDQDFTYSGVLGQSTEGKGAKFLGIDFHRTSNYDTSKLPTAQELKQAGIKKIVFLDETPPASSFTAADASIIYEPIDNKKMEEITRHYDTMIQKVWSGNTEEGLESFVNLEKALTPTDIKKKVSFPSKEHIMQTAEDIRNKKFGYTTKQVTREDIASYLQNIETDMPVIVEGVDLNKLETAPLYALRNIMDRVIELEQNELREKNAFTEIIKYIDGLI